MSVVIDGTSGVTTPSINAAAGNSQLTTLSVAGNNISAVNSLGFRNRIINGDMRIDQRNAGASVTITNTAATTYTLDRWYGYGSAASKLSVQQTAAAVTPPAGFRSYLGATSLSAYSLLTADNFAVAQPIEGYNVADLAWGTASAAAVTLSFWVRSSLTGTFGGAVRNGARSYPYTYTISAANPWEQKTITIPGDTSGTWNSTNGLGVVVQFGLGVGATYSGTAGAWASANYVSATGATSVVGTSGATFYITGVQLEAGSVASPFERRDYGRELMMCQRYYQVKKAVASGAPNTQYSTVHLPVSMRTTPTVGTVTFDSGSGAVFNPIDALAVYQSGVHTGTGTGTIPLSAEL